MLNILQQKLNFISLSCKSDSHGTFWFQGTYKVFTRDVRYHRLIPTPCGQCDVHLRVKSAFFSVLPFNVQIHIINIWEAMSLEIPKMYTNQGYTHNCRHRPHFCQTTNSPQCHPEEKLSFYTHMGPGNVFH